MHPLLETIKQDGVVAVTRGNFPPEVVLPLAETLLNEEIHSLELTINSVQPLESLRALKREFGDRLAVGMGTVLKEDDARASLDAGADFIVSPAFQPNIVRLVQDAGRPMITGVMTPTEAVQAWEMGLELLKLFPIGALGIEYFKAFFAPLDHMRFMCNGAMNERNTIEFLRAGAFAVGMGGWLTGDGTWSTDQIRQRARTLKAAIYTANDPYTHFA
jgi:2-dehydro-3-deoxyphosphogluconate aldolase / (4S)-4-hydroxy-2-oxoglutarate aldolase